MPESNSLDPLHVVTRLEGGLFLSTLARHIESVSDKVVEAGRKAKGKLTLNVFIEYPEKGIDGMVAIAVDFDPKPPKRRPTGQFYFVHQGELFDRPPESEPETPVRVVETPAAVVREQPDDGVAERKAE